MPVGERADEVVERAGAVPVALAIVRRLDLGDPVDQLQAVGAGLADRIDHHLAMRQPARAHHARARQHRLPPRHAAPHVDAGIARLAFVGEELLADRRIDAVAGDRDAAAHGEALLAAGTVGEGDGDTGLILRDAEAMTVDDDAIGARAVAERIEQHHLQIAAMDRELRMVVAGGAAERLLVDQLPEAVEEGRVLGRDRDLGQRLFKPERGEFLGRMRQQIDADADRAHLGNGFVDAAGNARLVQAQSERQAADAGADDDDLVHVSVPDVVAGDETRLVSLLSIDDRHCERSEAIQHFRG